MKPCNIEQGNLLQYETSWYIIYYSNCSIVHHIINLTFSAYIDNIYLSFWAMFRESRGAFLYVALFFNHLRMVYHSFRVLK